MSPITIVERRYCKLILNFWCNFLFLNQSVGTCMYMYNEKLDEGFFVSRNWFSIEPCGPWASCLSEQVCLYMFDKNSQACVLFGTLTLINLVIHCAHLVIMLERFCKIHVFSIWLYQGDIWGVTSTAGPNSTRPVKRRKLKPWTTWLIGWIGTFQRKKPLP